MNKQQVKTLKYLGLIIGVAATCMLFLPVLVFNNSDTSFTGLEVAFGHQFASLGPWASGNILFSPVVIIAFFLPLVAGLLTILAKNRQVISGMLYLLAALLIFMTPMFTTVTMTILDNVTEVDVEWTYGIGLIVAAILSIGGAVLSGFIEYKKI